MGNAAERRVKLLSAFTRGIICEFDRACRYRDVWATDEQLLAMPAAELIGRTIAEAVGEEVGRPLMEGTARVYETGTPETFEYTLSLPVGERAFEAKVVRVPDDTGVEPYRAVALIRDVTDEKALVRKLAEAERLASLGVLAAGIGHEINNPLMVVGETARLVAQSLDEASRADASEAMASKLRLMRGILGDALEEIERMTAVVADLRLLARDDRPASAIDANGAVATAIALACKQIRACALFEKDLAPALPAVMASEAMLVQVFLNLLVNATQALGEGDPSAHRIRVRSSVDARGWVNVAVSDTGQGLSDAERSKIFDPFYTTKRAGMGLGLSICRQIVTSYGGTIDVESVVGKGSTFVVALPAAGPLREATSEDACAAAHPRLRLLVIDDKPSLLRSLELSLDRDYDVVSALGARAALDVLARDARFDGILCDLMMPNVDGMAFFEELGRTRPELRDRVVFMTGGAFTDRARAFLGTIPNATIDKPFQADALRKVAAWRRT